MWSWRDLAVIYRSKFIGEKVAISLRAAGVPVEWVGQEGRKRFDPMADSVKVITMHSSKGLEFPAVAIPGLGYMPTTDLKPEDEGRLLYVAMTRAMEVLLMTSHRETDFVTRIEGRGKSWWRKRCPEVALPKAIVWRKSTGVHAVPSCPGLVSRSRPRRRLLSNRISRQCLY